jgi:hypothetical protein
MMTGTTFQNLDGKWKELVELLVSSTAIRLTDLLERPSRRRKYWCRRRNFKGGIADPVVASKSPAPITLACLAQLESGPDRRVSDLVAPPSRPTPATHLAEVKMRLEDRASSEGRQTNRAPPLMKNAGGNGTRIQGRRNRDEAEGDKIVGGELGDPAGA